MGKKGYLLLGMILFSFFIKVNAQEALPNFETSDNIIVPPSPPIEGEKPLIMLKILDYNSKELISDIHVNIKYLDKRLNKEIETLQYVDKSGTVKLNLENGNYQITLKVDKIDTPGKDYFIKFDLNVDKNKNETIYLFPVGSVMGNIYDNKNNAISNSILKFECSGNYGELDNKVTDSFGSFTSYWLPVGSCKISASDRNRVGYKQIEIKKGELNNVDIILGSGLIGGPNTSLYLIIIILIAFVIIFVAYNKDKIFKKQTKAEKIQESSKEQKFSKRTIDILNTLKEKEKQIVNFLLENNLNSTQAKIRYATGIPKTSLARLFLSLEGKKVICIESIGKLKKIKLTDWFLGKE